MVVFIYGPLILKLVFSAIKIKTVRGFFCVQFYTKSALLNEFVQLLEHICAVTMWIVNILACLFTARRYASALLAVIVCPSVCPSVCHKSELYKDG